MDKGQNIRKGQLTMRSYYGRKPPGQMVGIVTRPAVGLDEYSNSISVSDNFITEMTDAKTFKNEATELESLKEVTGGMLFEKDNTEGNIYSALATQDEYRYALLVQNLFDATWHIKIANTGNNTVQDFKMIEHGLPGGNLVRDSRFKDFDLLLETDSAGFYTWNAVDVSQILYKDNSCIFKASTSGGGVQQSFDLPVGTKIYIDVRHEKSTNFGIRITNGLLQTFVDDTVPSTGVLNTVFEVQNDALTTIRFASNSTTPVHTVNSVTVLNVSHETELTEEQIKSKYRAIGHVNSGNPIDIKFSSCRFNTEERSFICFTSSKENKLFYIDIDREYSDNTLPRPVPLPFTPVDIVSAHNRIFAIDNKNKVWWSRVGDFFTWIGQDFEDGVLVEETDLNNGIYTIAEQPIGSRPVTATVTMVPPPSVLGYVRVRGINELDQEIQEDLYLKFGRVQTNQLFKEITEIRSFGVIPVAGVYDRISMGFGPVTAGNIDEDAGYWTIEREKILTGITTMSNNIYIFARDNIYVLRGYSPETFTLSQLIVNFGLPEVAPHRNNYVTINNLTYFISKNDVYMFNGHDYPRLISHREYRNGALTNGVMGGIKELNHTYSIAADNDNIYLYNNNFINTENNIVYVFDTQFNSWWKRTGFSKINSPYDNADIRVMYITSSDTESVFSFISVRGDSENYFDCYDIIGHKGISEPSIITKAFNSSPSETGTLTGLILQFQGQEEENTDINVYYSIDSVGDTFNKINSIINHKFSGSIENIFMPIPLPYIINTHHYRIKIEFSNKARIYNIERRFRIRGMIR